MDVADTGLKPAIHAECFLVDVGQGACTIIYLGDGRAILIDCGPSISAAMAQFLRRFVVTIDALIISHNHADHDGGVARILQMYPLAIRRIYFLQDAPAKHIKTYRLAKREMAAGQLLNAPERLEAKPKPRILYPNENDPPPPDRAKDIRLLLYYPTFMEALDGENEPTAQRRSNRTSAILAVHAGMRTITLPGDASIESWRALRSRMGGKLLTDVVVLPHHGGNVTHRNAGENQAAYGQRSSDDMAELYSEIISPKLAVISVGSSNRYGHPKQAAIAAVRGAGAKVVCTQMTEQCCANLESIRPGLVQIASPSQSSPIVTTTNSDKSKDVACFGTVVVGIHPNELTIDQLDEHQTAVDRLAASGTPVLCRR